MSEEGSLCVNLLKKILLIAGMRPVTFSLVCKRWKRVVDQLSQREKWGYQLKLAIEANVPLAPFFTFDILDENEEDARVIFFVQKLTATGFEFYYNKGKCAVQHNDKQIVFKLPGYRLFGPCKRFESLRVYDGLRCPQVSAFKAFGDQYIWDGEVMCKEVNESYGAFIFYVLPHGNGDALVKGVLYEDIYAHFGCLHFENEPAVFPDMTQNIIKRL